MTTWPGPQYKRPPPETSHHGPYGDTYRASINLIWAVSVDPVQLGAHLESYIKLQPTFTAFRLCWTFGNGPQAFLHRLPIELVKCIEDLLTAEARLPAEEEWSSDYECFIGACRPLNHVRECYREELSYAYDKGPDTHLCDDSCSGEWCTKIVEDMDDWLKGLGEADDWAECDEHAAIQRRWYERFISEASGKDIFFHTHQELIRRQFGLSIFTCHTKFAESAPWGPWFKRETVTCLHLPAESHRSTWDIELQDIKHMHCATDDEAYAFVSTFSVPPPPKAADIALFPRAMGILGLTPLCKPEVGSVGLNSVQSDVAADGSTSEAQTVALSNVSPTLIMLGKNVAKTHNQDR
ncbi:hypothetical protein LTR36_002521 [Oleoguttula mirabilis]|uniref:Uncharacterized protein n=1 Tax=Oleoguttula mirabilis TaxID=1507867 RepID=A0AAV9JKF3_9PEZI|nr:hypothetical protein LTR36_002521 [Oleoguttula mirabilis]